MIKSVYLSVYLSICLSVSLNGQVLNSQEIDKGTVIQRNALFDVDEIKVRWKKAALENCPGVPCITATAPVAPTGLVATVGVASATASVTFVASTNNGGSAITGYTITSSPGGITSTGANSPISVTGLTNGTTYTFTVFATNAVGNSVASAASSAVTPAAPSFTCGTSTVSDYDGNAYNTVLIGTQCWTKSNLKVTKYNDGTLIPDLTNSLSNPWAPTSGARTGYDVSVVTLSDYVGTFGYLYNWYAVIDSRKLCPEGWYVPTDADWTIMLLTLDPSQAVNSGNVLSFTGAQSITAGTVMKSTVTNLSTGSGLGWNPGSPGTNTSGFSGLPGGFRTSGGIFGNIGNENYFYSATEYDNNLAWYRLLYSGIGGVYRNYESKSFGASVRCLRD